MNPTSLSSLRRSRRPFAHSFWLAAALALPLLAGSVRAQSEAREYDVKAALLFNLSQFVTWPPPALSDTDAPFVIAILGNDPFGQFLDELVKNERAYGKPIAIRRIRKPEDALDAHILFISKSEQSRFDSIFSTLKDKPILTVTDAGGRTFLRHGGMVAFLTEKGSIKLRINPEGAHSSGLAISSKLLRLAEIVHTEKT